MSCLCFLGVDSAELDIYWSEGVAFLLVSDGNSGASTSSNFSMECAQPGSSVYISVSLQMVSVPGSIVDSGSAKSATSLNADGGLILSKQSLALLVRTLVDMAAAYTSAMTLSAGFISSNMPSLFPGDCSDVDCSLVELSATSEVMLATLTILFSMSTISINSSMADGGLMLSR